MFNAGGLKILEVLLGRPFLGVKNPSFLLGILDPKFEIEWLISWISPYAVRFVEAENASPKGKAWIGMIGWLDG